jgi:hypothetical protein
MSNHDPLALAVHIGKPLAQAFPNWAEVQGELVKVQEDLFVVLDDAEGRTRGETPIHGLLWAASTGAALRAWFSNVEADEETMVPTSSHLKSCEYAAILSELKSSSCPYTESASYRIMSDGKFVHKSIQTRGRTYFFRSRDVKASEPAYAVLHTNA